jgi:2-dehydropantoate 2-reductase
MVDHSSRPRVAIVGLGGIGIGFAAAIAEGAKARAIGCARRPLERVTIERDGDVAAIDLEVHANPREAKPVEWVVLATKVYQTNDALPWLEALVDERTRIVVAQNGVHRDCAVAALVPHARAILPSVIYFNGQPDGNGNAVFRHVREVDLILPDTADAAEFQALLAPFFRCERDPGFEGAAWRKFLLNVAANSLTALTLAPTDVIRKPPIRELALRLMIEAGAAARASGVALPDDVECEMLDVLLAYPPGVATSMYLDRLEGRPTEVDAFSGAIVELGRRYGIACPANEVVTALLRGIGG